MSGGGRSRSSRARAGGKARGDVQVNEGVDTKTTDNAKGLA